MNLDKQQISQKWAQFKYFFEHDLWYRDLPEANTRAGILLRIIRFGHLMARGFRDDRLWLYASSLTFFTLMSLLPVLAIALAIAKGFGQDGATIAYMQSYMKEMPLEFRDFMQRILDIVSKTNFAQLGAIGGFTLAFLVIQMLSRIESTFNSIWGITRQRNVLRRFSNYLSTVTIVPILFVAAITLTANIRFGESLSGIIGFAPLFSVWLALCFLYSALPNTNVHFGAAVVGSFISTIAWLAWFEIYIHLQPGLNQYNAIYGALAFLPIFLAWLNVSWIIVLLGANITFAVQDGSTFKPELSLRQASVRTRLILAIRILTHAALALKNKEVPFDKVQFAKTHCINPHLLNSVLEQLDGLIARENESNCYILTSIPEAININQVINQFLDQGDDLQSLGIKNIPDERLLQQIKHQEDAKTIADLL